jgi:hypothetical protein
MWIKLDDGFFYNRKVQAAGKDGRALYLAALTYCARELTDGLITTAEVRVCCALADTDQSAADVLVNVGLWEEVDGGYKIHDFHEYNPTAEEVRARRDEISKVRAQAGKRGMAARWSDSNKEDNKITNPITKQPKSDNKTITNVLQTDNPVSRNPIKEVTKDRETNNTEMDVNSTSAAKAAETEFLAFVEQVITYYPRDKESRKPVRSIAQKALRKINKRERALFLTATEHYSMSERVAAGYVMGIQRFANGEWEGFIEPPTRREIRTNDRHPKDAAADRFIEAGIALIRGEAQDDTGGHDRPRLLRAGPKTP